MAMRTKRAGGAVDTQAKRTRSILVKTEMMVAKMGPAAQPYCGERVWISSDMLSPQTIRNYALIMPKLRQRAQHRHFAGVLDLDAELSQALDGREPLLFDETNRTFTSMKELKLHLARRLQQIKTEEEWASLGPAFQRLRAFKQHLVEKLTAHKIAHEVWFTGLKGFRVVILDSGLYSAVPAAGLPNLGSIVLEQVLQPFMERIGVDVDAFMQFHDKNVHDWNKGVKTEWFPHVVSKLFPTFVGPQGEMIATAPPPGFLERLVQAWHWIAEHAWNDSVVTLHDTRQPTVPRAGVPATQTTMMNLTDFRFAIIRERLGLYLRDGVHSVSAIKIVNDGANPPVYHLLNRLPGCACTSVHSVPGKGYLTLTHRSVSYHCHSTKCHATLRKMPSLHTQKIFTKMQWAQLFADTDAICAKFNAKYAFLVGQKESEIMDTSYIDPITDTPSFQRLSIRVFKDWLRNCIEPRSGLFESEIWLEHPLRRTYKDIFFDPGKPRFYEEKYNIWNGFDVDLEKFSKTDLGATKCARILRHFKEVLANNDEEMYEYLMNYVAHFVQFPEKLPRVALVLMGREGTGKGMLVDILSKFVSNHVIRIANNDHATGGFNAFMEGKMLVFFDESYFAGNRANQGPLYAYISEALIAIRPLFHDHIRAKNFCRVIISSNHDHVVPAGDTARRFLLLDINPRYEDDYEYFNALNAEIEDPQAIAAFFSLVQQRDVSRMDFRKLPRVSERLLWKNKYQTMDSARRWFYESLKAGELKCKVGERSGHAWPISASEDGRAVPATMQVSHSALQECYSAFADSERVKYRAKQESVMGILKDILKNAVDDPRDLEYRPHAQERHFKFPPLEVCRRAFEKAVKTSATELW